MEKSNFECLTLDNVELMYYAINKRHINKSFVELIRLIKVVLWLLLITGLVISTIAGLYQLLHE